ncbi:MULTISPECIES: ArsR/SmtB family transcription factor [Paenibacillus]|uniref:ArsR/SmtB family transcription factor n=1 Tax=Paenibacillus TaxID=44249 RepID=UPI000FD69109|nr:MULTISPECIES: metalloregulator ArsR/SmtB family transcription factor [Paenibacillus]MCP1309275.1 metalloregulator ArsR/SmtB family transcription factor [Paenibacillus tyrfis]NEN83049.1 helix-turn-helix transcriptional regulator [Paenibacillus elgii]
MTTQIMFNDEQRVKIFKALADETRLDIIRTLYTNKKEMNCGEVMDIRDTSKSNTSYHLRTLREAKLIKVRKEAQTKYMSIDIETFQTYLPGFLDTL